jgi:hypothetical protein
LFLVCNLFSSTYSTKIDSVDSKKIHERPEVDHSDFIRPTHFYCLPARNCHQEVEARNQDRGGGKYKHNIPDTYKSRNKNSDQNLKRKETQMSISSYVGSVEI